jgi:hypothetical protein
MGFLVIRNCDDDVNAAPANPLAADLCNVILVVDEANKPLSWSSASCKGLLPLQPMLHLVPHQTFAERRCSAKGLASSCTARTQ